MTELLTGFTTLPNLHPALVHFPLALVPVALGADLACLVLRRRVWLDRAAAVLWGLAAAGAVVARETGEEAQEALTGIAPQVQLAIGEHSDWALYSLWAVVVVALLRLGLAWRERQSPRLGRLPVRLLLAVAAVGALAVVLRTADLGGALVYRHGVAVAAVQTPAPPQPGEVAGPSEPDAETAVESRLRVAADGALAWAPLSGNAGALGAVLTPAPGSAPTAVVWYEAGSGEGEGLPLGVAGRALLVLPGSFGDVQVEAEVLLEDFEGTVGVAHHVADTGTAGLFTVSTGGEVLLADLRQGETRELDAERIAVPEHSFTLAVSAAGRHLKGFVADRQVAHGHTPSGEPGAAGLLLDGRGVVRVLGVSVTPLDEG